MSKKKDYIYDIMLIKAIHGNDAEKEEARFFLANPELFSDEKKKLHFIGEDIVIIESLTQCPKTKIQTSRHRIFNRGSRSHDIQIKIPIPAGANSYINETLSVNNLLINPERVAELLVYTYKMKVEPNKALYIKCKFI